MQKKIIFMVLFCCIVLIGTAFFRPLIIKHIMDKGLMNQNFQVILLFSILLLLLILLEEIIQILQTTMFVDIQNHVVLSLYTRTFQKLLYARISFFSQNNTAEIINSISTDIGSVGMLVDSNLMSLLSYIFRIVSGIVGLFVISWKLAILVLIIVPLKLLFVHFFSKKKETVIKQWIEEMTSFSACFDDTINGIREVKLWNMYKRKSQDLRRSQKRVLEFSKKNTLLETYNLSSDSLLQGIMVCLLYGIGGYIVCGNGLSIGGLTAFITYSNYVVGPISLVFNFKFLFAQVRPSIERLRKFFQVETEKTSKRKKKIKEFKKEISFEHISFAYKEDELLTDINLKIHKGEKIALVGDNGSGKSTLISLLLQFLNPKNGKIYMDGTDISFYDLEQYRALFGVISQDIYLFKVTVRNNIVMDQEIGDEKLWDICNRTNMREFINRLPKGFSSSLEKNGENLSGGERQKIAFLRVIIKDSPILVLDEATANIDKKYNDFIHQTLLPELRDKTIIIITHKLENLKGMDRIYQIENHVLREYRKDIRY